MKLLTAVALFGSLIPLIEAQGNSSDLYSEFELRVDEFLTETARKNGCDIYVELVRLYLEDAELFCEEAIFEEVSKVNAHTNSVDFYLHAFGFILHHFWDNPLLSTEIKREIVNAVINIPLFLSYPGELNTMQYWSENHQIGWYAAEYLIGTGLASKPDLSNTIFPSSGETAAYHADMGRYRVMRWLDFRLKYGFSEFNSDTYGPIAYKALVSVVACAPDQDVREKASIVMNLQLYDHILGSHGIKLATARGRAYSDRKLGQGQYGHMWLIKGKGSKDEVMSEYGSAQSTYFTLATVMGRYRIPETLLKVGQEVEEGEFLLEQRFGLGEYEGEVTVDDAENCTFWFGNGGYFSAVHPRCLFIVGDDYNLWDRAEVWGQIKPFKLIWDTNPQLVDTIAQIVEPLGHGSVLGPANMRTFRADGVMLSSVQNYKGGYMAGQQQAWQATLDYYRHGMIFSVQPTQEDMWVGGILPKIGQFGSTLISMYSPEVLATAVFGIKTTHAHFRQDAFDEYHVHMAEEGFGWLVGRQDDAFVALYSWQLGHWEPENINGEGIVNRDFVSEGVQNVYICEVGNVKLNGSFEDFVQNVVTSTVQVNLAYNDSLLECLVDNGCLDSFPELIGCLLDTCSSTSEELFRNELQSAVDHSDDQHIFSLVAQRVNNIRHSDVDVVYIRNSTLFEIGWNSKFTVDGNDISTDDFHRYTNRFTSMEWGARSIDIKTETSNLFMDFDKLSIVET